jgi:hypothetical protein
VPQAVPNTCIFTPSPTKPVQNCKIGLSRVLLHLHYKRFYILLPSKCSCTITKPIHRWVREQHPHRSHPKRMGAFLHAVLKTLRQESSSRFGCPASSKQT